MNAPDPRLLKAIRTHQAGRTAEAKVLYERILRGRPEDPDALNYLGMLVFQRGDRAHGVALLQRSVRSDPGNPHAWLNLGNMLIGMGRDEDGSTAYEHATRLAPEMWQGWFNRATCLQRLRRVPETLECLKRAIALKPDHDEAYERLGRILYWLGERQQMAELYTAWVNLNPLNPTARHMYAAALGEAVPDRASDEFVRVTFDKFAESFDDNLNGLAYQAPQLLADAIDRHLGPAGASTPLDILDAGAGTGLCGPLLRPRARRLVGVDLSPAMLDKARERRTYDELEVMELCAFMEGRPASFDLVVSADTLCYFGAREPAVAAAGSCLRPAGRLAFTVERLEAEDALATFRMGPHGRYLHAGHYLTAVLLSAGFVLQEVSPAVLRSELGQGVQGFVVLAQRAPA
ncbi:MAG: methyltransferase domain-containing protein [Steroidobacteraceae bacterium]